MCFSLSQELAECLPTSVNSPLRSRSDRSFFSAANLAKAAGGAEGGLWEFDEEVSRRPLILRTRLMTRTSGIAEPYAWVMQ